MKPSWRVVRPCDRCQDQFEPTRARQTMCRTCRRRLTLERYAAKQVQSLSQTEQALETGLVIVKKELDRWQNVVKGSPRKRGQWRQER